MSDTQITPIVLRTDNVARSLLQNAKSNGVDVKTLDFNLLNINTYIRYASDKEEIEWESIDKSELSNIDETDWLNPIFEIKQIYEIEIFPKEESPLDNLKLSIGANSSVTDVYLSIKSGSIIENYNSFENDLYTLVLITLYDVFVVSVLSKSTPIICTFEKSLLSLFCTISI